MRQLVLLAPLLLTACPDNPDWEGTWDVPTTAAVLQNEVGGPFSEPIGYGASAHGGQIAMMALKQGRYLTDSDAAAFVRASFLPTGRQRLISGLGVYAPSEDVVTVYATDKTYGQLLRIPHVIGLSGSGEPGRFEPTASEVTFVDADSTGSAPELTGIALRLGYTSTEEWKVQYDGSVWWVTGSRSGLQQKPAIPDEVWSAEKRAVEFVVSGGATRGDHFLFSTDSGIEEIDLGGTPLHLKMAPDQSRLAVVLADPDAETSSILLFDPVTNEVKDTVALPADSRPDRIAWGPDSDVLFASDLSRAAAWQIDTDGGVTEFALPWPVFDVAPLLSDDANQLFLAPTDGRSVWRLDLDTGLLIDQNPLVEGIQGMDFDTIVEGIEAIPMAYRWLQTDDEGVRMAGRSVAVSLWAGRVHFMGEETGCLVHDQFGPRTVVDGGSFGDYSTNFGTSSGGALLETNTTNGNHVIVNRCGGIALREVWTLTYRRTLQAWEVEGSRSGVQTALAREDERYISDTGAVSFTVRGGLTPSAEGWTITFAVIPGVIDANGDNDKDGTKDIQFDQPQDPVFFHYTVGGASGGWDVLDDRPFVLVPAAGSDLIGRVEPTKGEVEIPWW